MFHLIHDCCPELFNANVVHKFQRTANLNKVVYKSETGTLRPRGVPERRCPAVKVWFDDVCKSYVFETRGEYEEFIKELEQLCSEET